MDHPQSRKPDFHRSRGHSKGDRIVNGGDVHLVAEPGQHEPTVGAPLAKGEQDVLEADEPAPACICFLAMTGIPCQPRLDLCGRGSRTGNGGVGACVRKRNSSSAAHWPPGEGGGGLGRFVVTGHSSPFWPGAPGRKALYPPTPPPFFLILSFHACHATLSYCTVTQYCHSTIARSCL